MAVSPAPSSPPPVPVDRPEAPGDPARGQSGSPPPSARRPALLAPVVVLAVLLLVGAGLVAVTGRSGRSGGAVRPVKVLVAGDSTAGVVGDGLRRWALARPGRADIDIVGDGGCALLQEGVAVLRTGWTQPPSYGCTILIDYIVQTVTRSSPDLILLFLGSAELSDWLLPGQADASSIGQPAFDGRYTAAATAALRRLATLGIPILVTTTAVPSWDPTVQTGNIPPGSGPYRMNDAARTRRLNELTEQVVQGQPLAEMVRYAERLGGADGPVAHDVRPDGLHVRQELVPGIMEAGLEAELRSAYQRVIGRQGGVNRHGPNRWSPPKAGREG